MRTSFIIPLVLMSLVSFPSWGLTIDDLVQLKGLYYEKFNDVPFTCEIDEGLTKGNVENGKREGTWVFYKEDGTKRLSENKFRTRVFEEGSCVYRDGETVSE